MEPVSSKITSKDLCTMFHYEHKTPPNVFFETFDKTTTDYHFADTKELAVYLLQVLKRIEMPQIERNKAENLAAFEHGWGENLLALLSGVEPELALKPAYFRKTPYLRFNRSLIVTENSNLEYDLFTLARILIFAKYLAGYEYITEIGCGSCQNLLLIARLFPCAKLEGLDWTNTSVKIAQELSRLLKRRITGHAFDMLSPIDTFIKKGSAIITIHAMEQLGRDYEPFLQFIMNAEPGIVIHYEPIIEFYDDSDLLDYVALLYSRKRNYLTDYYKRLLILEAEGRIEILDAWRPNLGGVIHESSIIAWKVLKNKLEKVNNNSGADYGS